MMKLNSILWIEIFCVEAGHCLEVWGGLGVDGQQKGRTVPMAVVYGVV